MEPQKYHYKIIEQIKKAIVLLRAFDKNWDDDFKIDGHYCDTINRTAREECFYTHRYHPRFSSQFFTMLYFTPIQNKVELIIEQKQINFSESIKDHFSLYDPMEETIRKLLQALKMVEENEKYKEQLCQ